MPKSVDNTIQIQKRKAEKKREREIMFKEADMHTLHDDLYFGKHYAEPVCSRRLHSELKDDQHNYKHHYKYHFLFGIIQIYLKVLEIDDNTYTSTFTPYSLMPKMFSEVLHSELKEDQHNYKHYYRYYFSVAIFQI